MHKNLRWRLVLVAAVVGGMGLAWRYIGIDLGQYVSVFAIACLPFKVGMGINGHMGLGVGNEEEERLVAFRFSFNEVH